METGAHMGEVQAAERWDTSSRPEAEAHNALVVDRLKGLIRHGDAEGARAAVAGWPPADILAAMTRMRSKYSEKLLEWLPDELSFGVLSQFDARLSSVLQQDATVDKIRKVLARCDTDRALDFLDGLDAPLIERLIAGHPQEAHLRAEMAREADSAGYAMRHGLVCVFDTDRVADVTEAIRARIDEMERLERVFVVDRARRLRGYLRLRDLLLATPETPVAQLMRPDSLAVTAETDRAQVLELARARGRTDLAVVDAGGRLIGSITADDLADIARREAEEDQLLLAGVSPESTSFDTPLQIMRRRLPWILVGLAGSMLSASVIGAFEEEIARAAILATFVPIVMGAAGNAGLQAATVSVQAIAGPTRWRGHFFPRIRREILGAAINGLTVGAAVALIAVAMGLAGLAGNAGGLAAASFLALFGVVLVSATVGATVPFVLNALRIDPAVATTIFVSTINDVSSVLMFFVAASLIYLGT